MFHAKDDRLAPAVAAVGPPAAEQVVGLPIGLGGFGVLVGGHPQEVAAVPPAPPMFHHQLVSHAGRPALHRSRAKWLIEAESPDGRRERTRHQLTDGHHPPALSLPHVRPEVDLGKVHEPGDASPPDPGIHEIEGDQADLRPPGDEVRLDAAGKPRTNQRLLDIIGEEGEVAPARRQRRAPALGGARRRG